MKLLATVGLIVLSAHAIADVIPQGDQGYRFVFGGFLWVMLVSSHDLGAPLNQCTLSADGETALQIRNATEMQNLISFSNYLGSPISRP